MKISVDTSEDSPEDIRKVVALLSSLSDKNYSRIKKRSSNIFEGSSPDIGYGQPSAPESSGEPSAESSSNAFANMFGSSNAPSQSASETDDDEEEDDSHTEEEKTNIEIVPY